MIGIGWFNFPCPGALPRFFADPQDPQRLGRPHSPRHRSIVTLRGCGLPGGPHRWAASITDGTDPRFCWEKMGFTIWKPDEIHWNLGFRWFYQRFYHMKTGFHGFDHRKLWFYHRFYHMNPLKSDQLGENCSKIDRVGIWLSDFLFANNVAENGEICYCNIYQHRNFWCWLMLCICNKVFCHILPVSTCKYHLFIW